ncbi:hypothetical protein ABZ479_16635 [Streptomyces sp. NPDC005722]
MNAMDKTRIRTRTLLGLASAAACLVAVGGPAHAAPVTDGTTAATATHRVVVLDGVEPGRTVSRVAAGDCSTGPDAAARAEAAAPRAAAATELMTRATDADYGGEYTKIYGDAGPCDAAGYSFSPNSWWSSRLSSYLVSGGCTKSFASGPRGNATFTGSVPYVGSALNDAVTYIKVWRG